MTMQIMMSLDVMLYILIRTYIYTTVSEEYAASIFKVEYTLLL